MTMAVFFGRYYRYLERQRTTDNECHSALGLLWSRRSDVSMESPISLIATEYWLGVHDTEAVRRHMIPSLLSSAVKPC